MRIVRFAVDGEVGYGLVGTARAERGAGGEIVAELAGHPFGGDQASTRLTGTTYPLADVRLLAPVLPSKVIGFEAAGGGQSGAAAAGSVRPVMYLKPSTAVCGPADPVRYPAGLAQRVDAAGGLAVVVGRLCRDVPADQAAAAVLGYTCAIDITARDLAEADGQWARAKGFDTFCPLGPWIETGLDAAGLAAATAVNGQVRRREPVCWPGHGVPELVAYASSVMTLLPGDVLLTGAPTGGGAEPVQPGDEVSVTIEGIGTMTNRVEKGD